MKNRFGKHVHRLDAEEREAIWRRIAAAPRLAREERERAAAGAALDGSRRGPARRTGRLLTAGAATAALAAATIVIVILAGRGPEGLPDVVSEAATGGSRGAAGGVIADRSVADRSAAGRAGAVGSVAPAPAAQSARPAEEPAPARSRKADRPAASPTVPPAEALTILRADREAEVHGRLEVAADTAAPRPGALAAVVLDATTGDTLGSAAVSVTRLADDRTLQRDGRFMLAGLEPGGRYRVLARHLGFADRETTITAAAADTLRLALSLEPALVATLSPIDIEAEQHMVGIGRAAGEQKLEGDRFQKYAIGSVEDAVRKQSGAVMRAGEAYVRGGRSGEIGSPAVPPGSAGSAAPSVRAAPVVPPGAREAAGSGGIRRPPDEHHRRRHLPPPPPRPRIWTPPNDAAFDAMYFQHYGVNPFVITEEDALSTFALDADDASYSVARRYLREGVLPPPDAIRVEEFVNAFDPGLPAPRREALALHVDGMPSPYGDGYHLLRVGLSARDVPDFDRRPARLVFVIDTSGSMNRENRLGLVKRALLMLLDELRPDDTVGIVVYGSRGRVALPPTSVEDRWRIESTIRALAPGGSTNAEEGLELGYRMARHQRVDGCVNRLILCSDGVANQGRTGAEAILERVRREADEGIGLSTVGFGMGNYNDVLMEKLADRGDGTYHYVDRLEEAERVFRQNLTGLLQTVAEEAKVQVEFDPRRILRWRLLGYENRDVADEDFRNDAVDAGEIGAGHQVVALYEVKLAEAAARAVGGGGDDPFARPRYGEDRRRREGDEAVELATVRLRYRIPETADRGAGRILERALPVTTDDLVSVVQDAGPRLRLAAVVAEFAELLRQSYWARDGSLERLLPHARWLANELSGDPAVRELADLVARADRLGRTAEWREH